MSSVYVTVVFVLALAMYAVAFIVMNLDDIARRRASAEQRKPAGHGAEPRDER